MAEEIVSALDALLSAKKPTLGDIIKGFHEYVGKNEKEIASNIRFVLDNFRPATNLGRQLRIKLIDKYQVRDEVSQLLESGDSLNVNQALKCSWYFANHSDPAAFVEDFIPCLSLSTRLKVLNKYASLLKNSAAAEVIYEGVKLRYGTRTALSILPACGENFIRSELPNIKITLSPGILLSLFRKYPSLSTEYVKYLLADPRKCKNMSSYETVFVKLASKDLETFLELTMNHQQNLPYIKLGRRPTKTLLKTHLAELLDSYGNYRWFLQEKIVLSRLSLDQIKKLFVRSLLPPVFSEFLLGAATAQMALSYVKPVLRSDVVLTSFKTKYGRDMTSADVLYSLEETWIKYLPVQNKIDWLERKIQENVADAEIQAKYLAHLPVDSSMPRLKQLIESQSNANVRTAIAVNMVKTIKINQCSSEIKELFTYFVKRFRNETGRFRSGILAEISTLGKLFVDIEPDEWVPVLEFINILKLNHELYESYSTENIIREILDLRVQNSLMKNGNVDGCLKDYLDLATGDSKSCNHEYLRLGENTPYRSFCLQWLLNVVPQMKWADAAFVAGFHVRLYKHLMKFNRENPKSVVPCPEWLTGSIENLVNDVETNWLALCAIIDAPKSTDRQLWWSIVKRTFFRFSCCEPLCEILKFEPTFIRENILRIMEKALESRFENYSAFYKKARLYDPFGIPSEIAKLCRITLKLEDAEFDLDEKSTLASESSQPHAVGALAIVLPSPAFLEIALHFAPTSSRVEDYSEETQALHDIQKAIGQAFVDVTSTAEALPVLQKFAVGDYLKFVSGSLTSVGVRVPEKSVLPVLKGCMDCPVSLRKHYLNLLYRIAPTEDRVRIFVDIFKREKNVSLRLVLFQLLRTAFIEEPDDDTFRTFSSVLNQLTEEDTEALKELYSVEHIDDDFVGQYLELLWELSASKWASVVPKSKADIVALVTCRVIKLLSEDFCDKLLSHELSDKLPNACPAEFLCIYLIHAPSSEVQAARFSKVMASVQPLIKSCWDEYKFSSGHVFPVRHVVAELVSSLCAGAQGAVTKSGSPPVGPEQLLDNVKQTLAKLIKPSQFLRESLTLDLAITILTTGLELESDDVLVDAVVDVYKSYLQTHAQYQYPVIRYLVECAPPLINGSLLGVALISDDNPVCQIIGVELLEQSHISNEMQVPTYKTLIETLSASDNPAVLAMADRFFSSLESSAIL